MNVERPLSRLKPGAGGWQARDSERGPLITRIAFAIFSAIFATAVAAAGQAAEVKLQAVSFQPETVSFAKYFYRWIRKTNERCDGLIEIRVAGPATVPSQIQWHALKTGRVDMYYGPANYYRGALPEGDVLNLAHNEPGDQRKNGAWAMLNALHNKNMNAWYLTTLSAGIRFFVYTSKPAQAGRFDGLRLRSTPLYENFLRSLGAATRYIAAPALYAELKQGTIDGYVWPLWSGGHGWERFVKYRYGPGFMNTAAPVLVNLDRWKSLSDAQRRCLADMALWVEKEWPEWRRTENASQLAALRRTGVTYMDLGPSFARRAEDIYWNMLRQSKPRFVRDIRPLLKSAK